METKTLIKKIRVIGDVHGRTNWWDLVNPFDEEILYIFLGDYTDPYYTLEYVDFDQMIEQIEKMFDFKREHPDNVLILVGNYDLQYILHYGETNRYDYDPTHRERLFAVFEDNQDLIYGVAYNIGDKYLISHAGVTLDWFMKYCATEEKEALKMDISEIAEKVNKVWEENKKAFTFMANAKMSDYCGISSTQSPLWVRPSTLWYHNVFGTDSGKIQIVGHTAFDSSDYGTSVETDDRIATVGTIHVEKEADWDSGIREAPNDSEHIDIIMADCLRRETACVDIDVETMEWSKFYIEDVKSRINWN